MEGTANSSSQRASSVSFIPVYCVTVMSLFILICILSFHFGNVQPMVLIRGNGMPLSAGKQWGKVIQQK
jgi:hypothetical protein